ncbi:hypothetical protein [Longimicrobium sp.]|jgi:hypothetical protein|uniref:hypothetical protein n=1 Tax=Longimicrobium sp. TaxID=2029185 RepID=UPI002ED7BC25
MLPRIILAALVALLPAALGAQATVSSGSRVRVMAPALDGTTITGQVMSADSAALLLAVRGGTARVPGRPTPPD